METTIITREAFDSPNTHWAPGMLRHVVAALGPDNRVVITVDRHTGRTLTDVMVLGQDRANGVDYIVVAIPGDRPSTARFRVYDLGHVIVPLNRPTTAHTAAETYRAEQAAAITWGQAHHGRGRTDGEWLARPTSDGVGVVFVPADESVRADVWQVNLAVLRDFV